MRLHPEFTALVEQYEEFNKKQKKNKNAKKKLKNRKAQQEVVARYQV